MDVRTYRAPTMREALSLVRRELGPEASVLHTREVPPRWWEWLSNRRTIEVVASSEVNVPSRLPARNETSAAVSSAFDHSLATNQTSNISRDPVRDDLKDQLNELQALVQQLCRRSQGDALQELPEGLFQLYTELLDSDLSAELARELIAEVRSIARGHELSDLSALRSRVAGVIQQRLVCQGPFRLDSDRCHVVALVGPTGVGKTTTIAKLAANHRLRDKRKVGLITVDTYRIAAVEQLRTYAEIIDLPMQVVATPRQMREAVHAMAHLDLVLIDTAGRSPTDDVKIQELKSFLTEAEAHEVHLVLSATTGSSTLLRVVDAFRDAGASALLVTKLDEVHSLGNLLPVLERSGLPLSYVTHGQNVPDDIGIADPLKLSREILRPAVALS